MPSGKWPRMTIPRSSAAFQLEVCLPRSRLRIGAAVLATPSPKRDARDDPTLRPLIPPHPAPLRRPVYGTSLDINQDLPFINDVRRCSHRPIECTQVDPVTSKSYIKQQRPYMAAVSPWFFTHYGTEPPFGWNKWVGNGFPEDQLWPG
jgi:hypothetical protein